MNNFLKQNKNEPDTEAILAMVTHDLKNPVSSGILALKLLQNSKVSPLNPYQKEILDNIMVAFKYMKNLIENILDRYKYNNEVYSIRKMPVDFITLVNSAIEESKYIFSDKNQTVKLIVEVQNSNVELDSLEMRRVINNLIGNSSKYSPENSEIIIKLFDRENSIGLSIENKGCGFRLANPDDIFEKFVSGNDNSKSLASGLGLFIVRQIINAHDGHIFVESERYKFTRFTFTLPRK